MNIKIRILVMMALCTFHGYSQDMLKLTPSAVMTVETGVRMYIQGGLSLDNTTTLKNEGTITVSQGSTYTAGFSDATTVPYTYGSGQFVFGGAGVQSVLSPNLFGSLLVADEGLTLLSDLRSNNWMLQSGIVNTGAFTVIINSTAAGALEAHNLNPAFIHSWINGKVRRYINPATTNNYLIPVGNSSGPAILTLDNLSSNPLMGISYVNVAFVPKPGTDAGLHASESGTDYAAVHAAGVWQVIPDANPTGGKFDLLLSAAGFSGLNDNSFGILARPAASSTGSAWMVPAGSSMPAANSPGRTVAGGFAQRNNLTGFGQFGIGIALTPLPLELLDFSGVRNGDDIQLKWTTASENNTGHFAVYRWSAQGQPELIGTVQAAGSSSQQNIYSFTDAHPLTGINYYQLKMIDIDERFTVSNVVAVRIDASVKWKAYPNPVTGSTLFVECPGGTIKNIELITMDGKQVGIDLRQLSDSKAGITLAGNVAKGIYVLRVETAQGVSSQLVTVQ